MEMCYSGALVMPSSYAVMNEEEMTYVEGGATTAQKIAGAMIVAAVGVATITAIATGAYTVALVGLARVMSMGVWRALSWELGRQGALKVVLSIAGLSTTLVTAVVGKYL